MGVNERVARAILDNVSYPKLMSFSSVCLIKGPHQLTSVGCISLNWMFISYRLLNFGNVVLARFQKTAMNNVNGELVSRHNILLVQFRFLKNSWVHRYDPVIKTIV